MKFTASAMTSALLLAGSVAAAPNSERRRNAAVERRNARRAAQEGAQERKGRTSPPQNVKWNNKNGNIDAAVGAVYSGSTSNWAGAELNGSGVNTVSGTASAPTPSLPSGGTSGTTYAGSAWVGIDGGDGCDVIIQTGFDWSTTGSSAAFSAWYEWYPGPSYTFNITINEGDSVNMKVVASSSTSGTMYITNESTGENVSQFLSGQTALCESQGEWIVEDYSISGGFVPFAEFSPVSFTDCSMTDSSGTVGLSGASLVSMAQNGQTLATCSVSGSSTVNCQYGS